jgi:hypothetical protein
MDRNGQKWTEMDRNGQKWTEMDVVDAFLMPGLITILILNKGAGGSKGEVSFDLKR